MPPTVTSWGEWIGGLWPDDCWRREWIAAWAAIGWHAASALTLIRRLAPGYTCTRCFLVVQTIWAVDGVCLKCRPA